MQIFYIFVFVLQEIQAHYDEVHRQLQVTVDQYGIAQRKLQATTAELEEIRGNYESVSINTPEFNFSPGMGVWLVRFCFILQAMRGKRSAEQMYEDASTRISELTTINVNLSSTKSKLETELSTIASDYDEVTKELRVSAKYSSIFEIVGDLFLSLNTAAVRLILIGPVQFAAGNRFSCCAKDLLRKTA